jgi:hypothetical protein
MGPVTADGRETASTIAVLEAQDTRIDRLERALAQMAGQAYAVTGTDRLRRDGKTAVAEIIEMFPPMSPGFGAPGWPNERR